MKGQYRVIVNDDWARRRRVNEGTHRLLIEQWSPNVRVEPAKVKTEAWFDGYADQSFVRAHVWTGVGWGFVYAAGREEWQPKPGVNEMLNWPWMRAGLALDEWKTTERGRKAIEAFDDVRRIAWQIVCPQFLEELQA